MVQVIMENNDSLSSSVASLIEQLQFESEVEQDILNGKMLARIEITKQSEPDIDKNITELENLIKRLQAEIIEMSATASKPILFHGSIPAQKEESSKNNIGSKKQEASYTLSEMSNKAKEPESQNDGILEDHVEMCSENDSNTINEDNQKDAFNDVRQDFSVLWDDTTNSSNLNVTEKPIETGSNKRLIECRYHVLEPSLENDKSMLKDVISIESVVSTNNKCQIELTRSNASKFFEGTCPNDEVSSNNTRDDDQKISSTNELYVDSITNGVISEIVYENIMDNVPVLLNAETRSNLTVKNMFIEIKESNIEKHPSNVVNKTGIQSSATDLPKPGTVAAIKTKMQNLSNHVISTPVTRELPQTQSVIIEKTVQTIPKTDSLLKNFNRKFREMVGLTCEKTISQDKNDREDNFTSEEALLKAFPKSKSEPRKDFFTSDEDSSKIGPNNTVIPLTQDKFKTSNSVYSNNIAAENSMGFMNIVKKIIPSLVSNVIPDNEGDISDDGSQDKNFLKANLKTTDNIENPINTANDLQSADPANLVDFKPVVSVTNLDPPDIGTGTTNSGFSSMIPKFFGSDLKTDEVMKVEVEERTVEKTEQKEEKTEVKVEEKKEDDEEADKDDEDAEKDNNDDDEEEEEGGDDDDDNTFDV